MTHIPVVRIEQPPVESDRLRPGHRGGSVFVDGVEWTSVRSYRVENAVGEAQTVTLEFYAQASIVDVEA